MVFSFRCFAVCASFLYLCPRRKRPLRARRVRSTHMLAPKEQNPTVPNISRYGLRKLSQLFGRRWKWRATLRLSQQSRTTCWTEAPLGSRATGCEAANDKWKIPAGSSFEFVTHEQVPGRRLQSQVTFSILIFIGMLAFFNVFFFKYQCEFSHLMLNLKGGEKKTNNLHSIQGQFFLLRIESVVNTHQADHTEKDLHALL